MWNENIYDVATVLDQRYNGRLFSIAQLHVVKGCVEVDTLSCYSFSLSVCLSVCVCVCVLCMSVGLGLNENVEVGNV